VAASFAALLALTILVMAAVPATGASVCLRLGGCGPERDLLEVDMKGSRFSPAALPRRTMSPVGVRSQFEISTSADTHPSALREVRLEVDRHVTVDAVGLPACGFRQLAGKRPGQVRRVCRRAIVGRGEARISLGYPPVEIPGPVPGSTAVARLLTPAPPPAPLTLVNGGVRRGVTTLFAYAFLSEPVSQTAVARIEISRKRRGAYGWLIEAQIPKIADGHGSLTDLSLGVKRLFGWRKGRKSLLSARCPNGRMKLSIPSLGFRNEADFPGVAPRTVLKGNLTIPCKPKG
jgi:hypothetical protein